MSGGSLDYFYSTLEDHIGDFGDKELDDLVRDLATLFHDREWYLSSDTNEGAWRDSRDAFKKKWFTQAGRETRVAAYLSDLRDEVFEMLGLSDKRCSNCAHWSASDKEGFPYGDCDVTRGCMMHQSESCHNFVKK